MARRTLKLARARLAVFWPLPAGLAGGLVAGWELSRRGAWFDPVSWAIYTVVLIALVGVVTFWNERKPW